MPRERRRERPQAQRQERHQVNKKEPLAGEAVCVCVSVFHQ